MILKNNKQNIFSWSTSRFLRSLQFILDTLYFFHVLSRVDYIGGANFVSVMWRLWTECFYIEIWANGISKIFKFAWILPRLSQIAIIGALSAGDRAFTFVTNDLRSQELVSLGVLWVWLTQNWRGCTLLVSLTWINFLKSSNFMRHEIVWRKPSVDWNITGRSLKNDC